MRIYEGRIKINKKTNLIINEEEKTGKERKRKYH